MSTVTPSIEVLEHAADDFARAASRFRDAVRNLEAKDRWWIGIKNTPARSKGRAPSTTSGKGVKA